MPEYDFRCLDCGKSFSVTETVSEHESNTHQCPACQSSRVERVLSPFFAQTSKKS